MAKLSAWLITIIGILLILPLIKVDIGAVLNAWIIALLVLVLGISKLVRNYNKKGRR